MATATVGVRETKFGAGVKCLPLPCPPLLPKQAHTLPSTSGAHHGVQATQGHMQLGQGILDERGLGLPGL